MKHLAIIVAASFAMCSTGFAATQHHPKPAVHVMKPAVQHKSAKPNHQTVNTNVNHHTKTRPVPPHHTVHLTPQQRHDSAARMMQPIR